MEPLKPSRDEEIRERATRITHDLNRLHELLDTDSMRMVDSVLVALPYVIWYDPKRDTDPWKLDITSHGISSAEGE